MSDSKAIVAKLWNYCTVLRDDGLSYGDYLEQLTYLLFLKMADEQHQFGFDRIVPEGFDWPSLLERKGPLWKNSPNSPSPFTESVWRYRNDLTPPDPSTAVDVAHVGMACPAWGFRGLRCPATPTRRASRPGRRAPRGRGRAVRRPSVASCAT